MGGEGIEGRGKEGQDGKRGGRRGKGPSSKVLNSCLACPISFPASRMGEEAHGTGKSREEGAPLTA